MRLWSPGVKTRTGLSARRDLRDRVRPWTRTGCGLMGRSDKFFLTASGLMACVPGWHHGTVVPEADRFGKVIETFVENELACQTGPDSDRYPAALP